MRERDGEGQVKRRKHWLLPLLLLCLLSAPAMAERETLRFAPLPLEGPEAVILQVMPMLEWLSARSGYRFEVVYTPSYAELVERFRAGEIDVAYLGPLPYLFLRQSCHNADPVLHFLEPDGEAFYTCALFVSLESGIVADALQGRRVALTQPLSTCGYLMTDILMREAGGSLPDSRYRYLGSHDEAVLAVARGEADLAGARTSIGRQYRHLGMRVLLESEPVPSFSLVFNRNTLSDTEINRVAGPLAALTPLYDPEHAEVTASWGSPFRHGAVPGSDRSFDVLRGRIRIEDIPMEDSW